MAQTGSHVYWPELILPASPYRELKVGTTSKERANCTRIGAEDCVMKEATTKMERVRRVVVEEHSEYGSGGFEVFDGQPGHIVGLGKPGSDPKLFPIGSIP